MKRKIYADLLTWKQKRKGSVALLIEGARRVGKSYIVETFARQEYESYLLIDFSKANPEVIHRLQMIADRNIEKFGLLSDEEPEKIPTSIEADERAELV